MNNSASVLETDHRDAPGFIISSKTQASYYPLTGIVKLQGGMEQCNGHSLCNKDG